MFNCQTIREEPLNSTYDQGNALTILHHAYTVRNVELNSFVLREFADEPFIEFKQHDAHEFFMRLCVKPDIVKNAVKHKLTTKTIWKGCQYTLTVKEQPNIILLLTVPQPKKVYSSRNS